MIINYKDVEKKFRELKNGQGIIAGNLIIDQSEFFHCSRGLFVNELKKNSLIEIHRHDTSAEMYYIIEGNGNYYDAGQWIKVKQGDILFCNYGDSHGLEALTDVTFLAMIVDEKYN